MTYAPEYGKGYSTDLSDGEWECLELHVPAPCKRERPRTHSTREILNAIFLLRAQERLPFT
jgi:transposase